MLEPEKSKKAGVAVHMVLSGGDSRCRVVADLSRRGVRDWY